MFAIDDSASTFWARLMRGMQSIAIALTFCAARRSTTSGFCAGKMNETSSAPARIRWISCGSGARTLATTSAAHASSVGTIVAPAAVYCASGKLAAAPAPRSTTTVHPLFTRRPTAFGEAATRRSSGRISLTMETFMESSAGGHYERRRFTARGGEASWYRPGGLNPRRVHMPHGSVVELGEDGAPRRWLAPGGQVVAEIEPESVSL